MNTPEDLSLILDGLNGYSGYGDLKTSLQNAFGGFNLNGSTIPLPANSDNYGYTFFTRPGLNLSQDNCLAERRLMNIINQPSYSVKSAVRALLDPIAQNGWWHLAGGEESTFLKVLESSMIDAGNPFMPILSNTLLSLSGGPDQVASVISSAPGVQKEVSIMLDGALRDYSNYSATANFRNVAGDPISAIFNVWNVYGLNMRNGTMVPYFDNISNHTLDYTTRIYRFTTDPSRTYIREMACTGYSFPWMSPMSHVFNFNSDTPQTEENAQISITFECSGVIYNDPIIAYWFNDLVTMYDSNFALVDPLDPSKGIVGKDNWIKLATPTDKNNNNLNKRCRPYINVQTMELEWYVPRNEYVKPL